MFDIKQFVTQDTCLKCKGCCRFTQEDSIWQPSLLEEEVKKFSEEKGFNQAVISNKKINLLLNKSQYTCSFFGPKDNRCGIYNRRPFECRLYPFLINKESQKVYLAVDLNCPFVKDKLENKEFKDYVNYLDAFLNLPVVTFTIKQNPQIIADYSKEGKLKNLATLTL